MQQLKTIKPSSAVAINNNFVVEEELPIIAMGGSAGSLQAFEVFFKHMPNHTGYAFVIIMHLPTVANIDLPSLFQKFTAMPVVEALEGLPLLPNHVYVIPPNRDMGIHKNTLTLFSLSKERKLHYAINFFLQSLAEEKRNLAVAIILSGMGADGELGVKIIKQKNGMVVVQDPQSAQFKAMPEAAISTGSTDFILLPEEMPKTLIKYLNNPVELTSNNNEYQQKMLQKILLLLRSHIGHDFTLYKENTIIRRIERRISFRKLETFEQYLNYITDYPIEMEILFKELLIGVTKFFRDKDAFQAITNLFHERLLQKTNDKPIRIWIAGCSTGEEAYSIAILIMEFMELHPHHRQQKAQIFATDLDSDAIEVARLGFYPLTIKDDVSEERLNRYFIKKNNGYVVKKELREIIVFAKHNLIKDAPFTRLDLLSCRNVMIYFSATLQKKLLPVFHYSLNKNGLLFLGPAETVGGYNEAFNLLDAKWKIFMPIYGFNNIAKILDFPFNIATQNIKSFKESAVKQQIKNPMANSFHKILIDHYTPASLLVNEKGDILYINGNMNRYLQFNSGEAIMNIHKIAREELKYPIGNALTQVYQTKNSTGPIEVKVNENTKSFKIAFIINPIEDTHLEGLAIIIFKDIEEIKRKRKSTSSSFNEAELQTINELEKELDFTKQQLHATIEQMESSLEELKSTNEELQSTNEELQSTNEEALTTKEEMQSLNEELMTINLQYQDKAEELTRLNNDMKNLLDNTEIGTIFLDNQLNILRFTPQVNKLFNVIPQDVGRSITHIVSNFDYPGLEQTINEVIERLAGKELEVKTKKNEWYNLRIMPYRTMDNFISGAVLTFTKITPLKALENRLSAALSYLQTVVDEFGNPAIVLDKEQNVLAVNKKFLHLFHLKENEIKEHFFMEVVINKWKTKKLVDLLKDKKETEFYLEHVFPEIGLLKLMIKLRYVADKSAIEHTAIIVTFEKQDFDQHEKQQGKNHINT